MKINLKEDFLCSINLKCIYFYLILNKSKYEDEFYFIFPLVKYRHISKLENNYSLTIIAFDEYR